MQSPRRRNQPMTWTIFQFRTFVEERRRLCQLICTAWSEKHNMFFSSPRTRESDSPSYSCRRTKQSQSTSLKKRKNEIQFGEVAMAPPSLTTKPKKAAEKLQGASTGLLLSSMLGHSVVSTSKPSMARQRMMEEERERVVQAYRHLKMQKQEQQERQKTGLNRLRHP
ncbi:hypothetical protein P4O66_007430, partial [Electrophorus voltai]